MKRFKKKVLALLLLVSLLMSMVGCSNTTNMEEGQTNENVSTTEAAEASKKPITLSIFGAPFATNFTSGKQDDPIAKAIEAATGITIDIDAQPDQTKWQTMLATGDLPDIIMIAQGSSAIDDVKPLIEGGLIIPLDDLLEQYGSDIKQSSSKMLEYSKKYVSNQTDELYFLLGFQEESPKQFIWEVAPNVRWDYYAELGYPEINSAEDWLNVVEEMVNAHPTNEDGKKVYGFSPWFDWGLWSFNVAGDIIHGLEGKGINAGFLGDTDMVTEKPINQGILSDDSSIIKGIRFFYQANRRNLIDPDAFIQKYDNALEKYAANRVMSCIVNWVYQTPNALFQAEGKTTSGYLPLPVNSSAYYMDSVGQFGQISRGYAISTNCEEPERAMELLNYIFSYEGSRTLLSGIAGQDYQEIDGKLVLNQDIIAAQQSDSNFSLKTGIQKYYNYVGLGSSAIDPKYNQPVNLFMTPEAFQTQLNGLTEDYCNHYDVSYPAEVMYDRLTTMYQDASLGGFAPATPDDLKEIEGNAELYLNNEVMRLVLAQDDAEFDAVLEEIRAHLIKLGVEKVIAFKTQAADEALAKRAELIGE